MRQFLVLASILLGPAAAFASNVDYGSLMFLGDSITVAQRLQQRLSRISHTGFEPGALDGPRRHRAYSPTRPGDLQLGRHEPVDVIFVSLEPWDRR